LREVSGGRTRKHETTRTEGTRGTRLGSGFFSIGSINNSPRGLGRSRERDGLGGGLLFLVVFLAVRREIV
jgi:hypothetical protein